MGNLKKLVLNSASVSDGGPLSPEYWLSKQQVESFAEGIALSELVHVKRQTSSIADPAWLVLDTGNADRGLLNLRGNESKDRTSQKKYVPEGAVIVSRLRPYLKQVAYLPIGTTKQLNKSAIYCSTEFYVLVSKSVDKIAYLVPWLLSDPVQAVFEQATTGGHHPRFDEDLLEQLVVPHKWHARRNEINDAVEIAVADHLTSQLAMSYLVESTRDQSSSSSNSINSSSDPVETIRQA